jgi:hypothetical protein
VALIVWVGRRTVRWLRGVEPVPYPGADRLPASVT